jgi:hypothetical protein
MWLSLFMQENRATAPRPQLLAQICATNPFYVAIF